MKRNFGKRLLFFLLALGFASVLSANTRIRVLGLSATSSKDPGFDLTCLLDGSCKAGWEPGLIGSGAEEGVSILFEKPVTCGEIRIQGQGDFEVSANGGALTRDGQTFSWGNEKLYVKSLFVHVGANPQGATILKGIQLVELGRILSIQKPLIVSAEVHAENILSPEMAYGPFRLFDSKAEFGMALDGKKIDPKKPVKLFDLTFKDPIKLNGFFFWNGYQRSKMHYEANARPKKLTVKSDASSAEYALHDEMDSQWLALPDTFGAIKNLKFEAKDVWPGGTYKDLVVSELTFVTDQDQILLLNIKRPVAEVDGDLKPVIDKALKTVFGESKGVFMITKFRSDGTFAAFKETLAHDKNNQPVRSIWEGNWERAGKSKIKVFGRAYNSVVQMVYGVYGQSEVEASEPKIFHTTISIKRPQDLGAADRDRLYKFAKATYDAGGLPKGQKEFWDGLAKQNEVVFIESNLFSDFVAPESVSK